MKNLMRFFVFALTIVAIISCSSPSSRRVIDRGNHPADSSVTVISAYSLTRIDGSTVVERELNTREQSVLSLRKTCEAIGADTLVIITTKKIVIRKRY